MIALKKRFFKSKYVNDLKLINFLQSDNQAYKKIILFIN